MINSLTKEQTSLLPVYRDKWIDIGLSTAPIDIEKSLAAIKAIYEQSGNTFPEKYEVYDSPFAAVQAMEEKYDIAVNPNDFCYGSHDAMWVSFYDYFLSNFKIKDCERVLPFIELAKHCGWVLLYDELVVITHRPVKIQFDNENRGHCENGLAIEYRDGTGVAMWHGVAIPSEWIYDKRSITPNVMFTWANIEQRRAACEIVGWAHVIDNLSGTIIDQDEDPTIGTLYEVDFPDSGKEKFLVAIDPNTNKKVGLSVPKEMKTALEANSWTYGIDKFEFVPEFRV